MPRRVIPKAPEVHRLDERVLAVCDVVGDFIETWGFRSIHGRVWTMLALSNQALSQSQVAEQLGVSRSLVHLAVTELMDYGLVRPTNGGRNAPYEARIDVWPTVTQVLREREWMLIERARMALVALEEAAEQARIAGFKSNYDLQRIRLLLAMTELAQTTLKAILSVRMPGSLDAFAKWLRRSRNLTETLTQKLPKLMGV